MPAGSRQRGEQRNGCENRREDQGEQCRNATLFFRVVLKEPSAIKDGGTGEAANQQSAPGFDPHHGKHRQVQQANVREENDLMVFARGKQQRSAETADHGERRQDFRVLRESQRYR